MYARKPLIQQAAKKHCRQTATFSMPKYTTRFLRYTYILVYIISISLFSLRCFIQVYVNWQKGLKIGHLIARARTHAQARAYAPAPAHQSSTPFRHVPVYPCAPILLILLTFHRTNYENFHQLRIPLCIHPCTYVYLSPSKH